MHNGLSPLTAKEANANWFENAVLVYGPRKAGTTLLHNLLDGGNDLFVYPEELKLKRLLRYDMKSDDGAAEYHRRSRILEVPLPRFDAANFRASWAKVIKRRKGQSLKEFIRLDLAFVIDSIVGAHLPSPQGWCAKEVGGDTRAIVSWWLANFYAPRVVFIMRNPLMVTRAVLNDRRRKQRRLSVREIVRETLDPIRVSLAQKAMLGRPEILTISYENLVAHPRRTMRQVAAFLGIEDGSYLAQPSIFGEAVIVRTASQTKPGVFDSDARWQDGLSLRERLIVGATSAVARLVPRLKLDYAKLVSELPASP
jgi:hypothetical protein